MVTANRVCYITPINAFVFDQEVRRDSKTTFVVLDQSLEEWCKGHLEQFPGLKDERGDRRR